ncbi:MAG TPA: saccharopine dehydrogenase NADP-binding domain-containing protein [Diaminobutyricibacter sp.]
MYRENEIDIDPAPQVVVYGAYGHTGRFVVSELASRGLTPVLAGRDRQKLEILTREIPGVEARVADVDDPGTLDRALEGAAVVVNCAGPFAATSGPLIEATLRARLPYVDVAAEIEANDDTFTVFGERAAAEGAIVVPAMAFYGGLGDLLATAAMGDWAEADEVHVAYGMSGWHPTAGTRAAGAVSRQRRGGRHVSFHDGTLRYGGDESALTTWRFPAPLGERDVRTEFSMADIVTIPRHLSVPDVFSYMTVTAATELASDNTPAPVPVDESGKSDQTFTVDVIVHRGAEKRRASATGQDIYAVTGPLAVEAVVRILTGRTKQTGVAPAGAMFDAADFLDSLVPHVAWSL